MQAGLHLCYDKFSRVEAHLTLKAPITTAADDTFFNFFHNLRKKGMIFRENRVPADDSHEISCLADLLIL